MRDEAAIACIAMRLKRARRNREIRGAGFAHDVSVLIGIDGNVVGGVTAKIAGIKVGEGRGRRSP